MKKFGKVSILLVAAMSMAMMGGCGKKNEDKTTATESVVVNTSTASDATTTEAVKSFEFDEKMATDMVEKFYSYCQLGEYKQIEYNAQNTVFDESMVKERVETLRNSFSTTSQVKEGTAKSGDVVNIDYVGSVDGVEFAGGSTNGAGYDLTLGSGMFIPGFEDQIIGHKVGETFDINVTFPDPYQSEDLAGKAAVFKITINYIVETKLPEYNDAFVASYTDAKTVAEYEEKAKNDIIAQNKSDDDYTNMNTVMNLAIEGSVIETFPEDEVNDLVQQVIDTVEQQAGANQMTLDDYVVNMAGLESVDAFKEYLSEQARGYLKQKIFVCAVAKQENITITVDDFNSTCAEIMMNYGMDRVTFENTYTVDEVVYVCLSNKVNKFILDNASPAEAK